MLMAASLLHGQQTARHSTAQRARQRTWIEMAVPTIGLDGMPCAGTAGRTTHTEHTIRTSRMTQPHPKTCGCVAQPVQCSLSACNHMRPAACGPPKQASSCAPCGAVPAGAGTTAHAPPGPTSCRLCESTKLGQGGGAGAEWKAPMASCSPAAGHRQAQT